MRLVVMSLIASSYTERADWKLFPIFGSRHNLGFFASYFEVHLKCIPYQGVVSIPQASSLFPKKTEIDTSGMGLNELSSGSN